MGRIGRVAIIGGGLSGLAAAYTCKAHGVAFTVFEPAHHMGGNMRTLRGLDLGMDNGRSRWVDLGVNDFSLTGYVEMVKVMEQLKVEHRALQDVASYSTIAGDGVPPAEIVTGYTLEKGWKTAASPAIEQGFEDFRKYCEAHIDELMRCEGDHVRYMTVAQFLEVSGLARNTDFVNLCLYPRIAGMYFTSRVPPGELPFRVILHYYYLQEGLGKPGHPDPMRRYWVNGVSSWTSALCAHLDPDFDGRSPTESMRPSTAASFRIDPAGYAVVTSRPSGGGGPETVEAFDAVVIARQAWDVMSCFETPQQAHPDLPGLLQKFRYSDDEVVVHTATSVMPPNVNAWSTYNLNIPRSYTPEHLGYTMTYWCNRHQNDPDNPEYNWQDSEFRQQSYLPNYFCTINPLKPLPSASILRPRGGSAIPGCSMFRFRHNIMDMAAYRAQEQLPNCQGHGGVWLVGGYTTGVGLQEECWVGAVDTAEVMLGSRPHFNAKYRHDARGAVRIPAYIRHLVHGARAAHGAG
jgi:uncharacterized protein